MQQSTERMDGKLVLITGATNGIGKATAQELAQFGAQVVVVGRDRAKAEATVAAIKQHTGNNQVDYLLADLSSQRSIRQLADAFKQRYDHLDVLINNAGGVFEREKTVDGLELTFALNHLAYFLLTSLLLDLVKQSAPSRIINVSSDAHRIGQINFDDLQGERKYRSLTAYSQSKLANVLFTYELARRLRGTGVTVNAVHPGVIASGFGTTIKVFRPLLPLAQRFMRTPERGAETSVYLASSPEVQNLTGTYWADSKAKRSSAASYDNVAATRLWQVSEALTEQ